MCRLHAICRPAGSSCALLAAVPGDVYVPCHGYLPSLAGKRTYAHWAAIYDVLRGGATTRVVRIRREMRLAFVHHRFRVVFEDDGISDPFLDTNLNASYHAPKRVFQDREVFRPVTGFHSRPDLIYVPLDAKAPPPRSPAESH